MRFRTWSLDAGDMKAGGLMVLRTCRHSVYHQNWDRERSWRAIVAKCFSAIHQSGVVTFGSARVCSRLVPLPVGEWNPRHASETHRLFPAARPIFIRQGIISGGGGNLPLPANSKRSVCYDLQRGFGSAQGAAPTLSDLAEEACDDECGNDVQLQATTQALENYLRKHKGLPGKDAEFVSRNCPAFIQKLVAIGGDANSNDPALLERALVENAVNELEPFFESIGMNPEKLDDVLSVVQVALGGEQGLLKSMEVLESLGIPRRELWNVLERNKQLLTLTAGDLQATVDFLEGLGVKRKDMAGLMQYAFFIIENLATLQHLERIGIQKHVIAEILKSDPQDTIDMPVGSFRDRVDFLLASGLSESEVEQSLRLFPQLLHLRLENLKRKIQFFDSIGLEREKMAKIISRWPLVFRQSVEKKLRPKIEMLQSLGVGREGIAKILTRYPEITAVSLEDNLKQKVAFFEANGLTGRRLVKLMTSHPRALTLSVNDLNKKLDFFKLKGFALGSVEMVRALGVCITISTGSLEARFLNLESLGLSLQESREIVKQQPAILTVSEKCIQDKVHYLTTHMDRSVQEVVKCPSYLLYSLEMRIKPRHKVLSILKENGLLREEAYSLNTIMIMSERRFIDRFVTQYPQAAAVYKGGVGIPYASGKAN